MGPAPTLVLAGLTTAASGLNEDLETKICHRYHHRQSITTHLEYLLDLLGGGGLGLGPALVVPGVRLHHGADHQLGPAPRPALLKTEDI